MSSLIRWKRLIWPQGVAGPEVLGGRPPPHRAPPASGPAWRGRPCSRRRLFRPPRRGRDLGPSSASAQNTASEVGTELVTQRSSQACRAAIGCASFTFRGSVGAAASQAARSARNLLCERRHEWVVGGVDQALQGEACLADSTVGACRPRGLSPAVEPAREFVPAGLRGRPPNRASCWNCRSSRPGRIDHMRTSSKGTSPFHSVAGSAAVHRPLP